MNRTNIIPVILSGGSGTRLWPLSQKAKPKQFLNFGGEHSLIQETILRCSGPLFNTSPILVGSAEHRLMLAESARSLGVIPDIVLEPMRRDSCAAIVAGALLAMERDRNCIILVVAADHHIPDGSAFAKAVVLAVPAAEAGMLVAFGIRPLSPATGYGYILPGNITDFGDVAHIERFVEKPDSLTATKYINSGFLWNSGNFLFRAKALIDEARQYVPAVVDAMEKALGLASRDTGCIELENAAFAISPQISFDYAVMEKTSKACVLPVEYNWSDIGTWDAVCDYVAKDEFQNAIIGVGRTMGSRNVTIHSEGMQTAVIGCQNLVVVATRDAVLVVELGRSEDVKNLVKELEQTGPISHKAAPAHVEPNFAKQLSVGKGQTILLQASPAFSTSYVVLKGRARVHHGRGEAVDLNLDVGQSFWLSDSNFATVSDISGVGLTLLEVRGQSPVT
jgi:mannose-1-phosphate guanylyltransferase / mannose-6-phosphate isomerase